MLFFFGVFFLFIFMLNWVWSFVEFIFFIYVILIVRIIFFGGGYL